MEIRAVYDKLLAAIRNRRTRDKPRECCHDIGKSKCAGVCTCGKQTSPLAICAFDCANSEIKFIQVIAEIQREYIFLNYEE